MKNKNKSTDFSLSPFLFTDFDLFIYFVVKKEVMLCENSDNNNKNIHSGDVFDEINIFIMENEKKSFSRVGLNNVCCDKLDKIQIFFIHCVFYLGGNRQPKNPNLMFCVDYKRIFFKCRFVVVLLLISLFNIVHKQRIQKDFNR